MTTRPGDPIPRIDPPVNRIRRFHAPAFISGAVHSGKTTLARELADRLKALNYQTAGVLSIGRWRNSIRSGFDLLDLSSGQQFPLAERHDSPDAHGIAFTFSQAGLDAGRSALRTASCSNAQCIFVDEIGKLELADEGWAPCLAPLLAMPDTRHVWVVRSSLVDSVCKKWNIQPSIIVDPTQSDAINRLLHSCKETS